MVREMRCGAYGESVEVVYTAVLYEINKREKPALDKAEALGNGYEEEAVDVVTSSGTYKAVAYVATSEAA